MTLLTKGFFLLACFGSCCLVGYSVFSFYSGEPFPNYYLAEFRNRIPLLEMAEETRGVTLKETETTPGKVSSVLAPGRKGLGPCPATPPGLVGPLLVQFDVKRTLEEVKEAALPLEEGGRYKPSHCISQQKVAIIIPFRNRHEHLKHWLFYLHPILKRQQLDYGIYVINQYGNGTFNRAKLLNVGFVEALNHSDYNCFVFSDVDLVPLDDRNLYRCFDQPRHLAVGMDKFGFDLPYKDFFGGVSSLSTTQFRKVNGYSNTYWGWGAEDDDLYQRISYWGMSLSRPDVAIGRYKMVRHKNDLHNEPNPVNPDKLEKTFLTMKNDGLNSLEYKVIDEVKDLMYTFITVDIHAPLAPLPGLSIGVSVFHFKRGMLLTLLLQSCLHSILT